MAVSDNVFSDNQYFIYNKVWRLGDHTSVDEINLFHKKLQFVNNVINESSRDIIICSTLSAVLVIL